MLEKEKDERGGDFNTERWHRGADELERTDTVAMRSTYQMCCEVSLGLFYGGQPWPAMEHVHMHIHGAGTGMHTHLYKGAFSGLLMSAHKSCRQRVAR